MELLYISDDTLTFHITQIYNSTTRGLRKAILYKETAQNLSSRKARHPSITRYPNNVQRNRRKSNQRSTLVLSRIPRPPPIQIRSSPLGPTSRTTRLIPPVPPPPTHHPPNPQHHPLNHQHPRINNPTNHPPKAHPQKPDHHPC